MRSIFTALVLGAVGGMDTWADNELPRIRFIATGGTIATRGGTRMSAEEVLQLVPGLQRYARPEPEQFANIASTAMTLDQWVQLAKRVNEVFDGDAGLDRRGHHVGHRLARGAGVFPSPDRPAPPSLSCWSAP